MSFKKNIICEEFRREMWKYIDGTLSDEEKSFWERHLDSCLSCRTAFNEVEKGLIIYESLPLEDLSDDKFDTMIEKAVNKSRFLSRISGLFSFRSMGLPHISFSLNKIALGTTALTAIIIIMFFIYKPEFEQNISEKLQNSHIAANEISNGSEDKKPTTIQKRNEIISENHSELAAKTPSVKTRHEVMEWKAQKISDRIKEVGNSLEWIDQAKERRLLYRDKWSVKAVALGNEIERLEKEINDSSL